MKRKQKNLKKIFVMFLSFVMVLSLLTPPLVSAASYTITTIKVGESQKLKTSGFSWNTTWTSADENIATVSSRGTVTGVNPGNTTVTATINPFFSWFGSRTKTEEFSVTVIEGEGGNLEEGSDKNPDTGEDKDTLTLSIGEKLTLKTSASGATAWKSSDTNIATVDDGVVTGIAAGDVMITATIKTEGKKFWFFTWGEKITTEIFQVTVIESTEIPNPEPGTKEYTVTFETNGGNTVDSQNVKEGETVSKPDDPLKEGYIFKGWYTDEKLEIAYDFSTLVTKDIILYAKWEKNEESEPVQYTVSFETNGGNTIDPQTVEDGQMVQKPNDPVKEGYTFAGWYSDEALENSYDFSSSVTENITLYARWIQKEPGNDIINESDFNLGEDVIPDLTYESEEAKPTYDTREDEIANIAEINNGTIPESYCDENDIPVYIDGKFSDRKVDSAEDAISALNDIHHIMEFENAEQEFTEVYSETVDLGETSNFYRFQQTYHNIPVYGYHMIVSTNASGEIQSLNGHYIPDLDIDITPKITMEQAKEIAYKSSQEVDSVSDGLYIYIENDNVATLCWKIRVPSTSYFINAIDGNIIVSISENKEAMITGEGTDLNGETISFPVIEDGSTYILFDPLRNIGILDSNHQKTVGQLFMEESNDNWNSHPEAITVYSNMIKIFDYYTNVFGRDGADNNHKKIFVSINYRDPDLGFNENGECANGIFSPDYQNLTYIAIGEAWSKPLDLLAHEYTHAITDATWGGVYINESGALNEAYSDIIGELIQNDKLELVGEDLDTGAIRSFSNPGIYGNPSHYDDLYTGDRDNGGVHTNSSIINHAAYLIDQNWTTDNHADELAALFYKSMYYLSPNSTFTDCRFAVLSAANSMNMNKEKINVITDAFSEVGIVHEDKEATASAHHIIGEVKDAETGTIVSNAEIIASATEGLGGGIAYTDAEGKFDIKVNRAIYKITVKADDYMLYTEENVDLSSWTEMDYYMDTIYLTPSEWAEKTNFISGTITDVDGNALEGVTIKFREGFDNKEGTYIQTTSGLDIELTTDDSGQYYTIALQSGNYTLEASKNGYNTGYLNVISGNDDSCNNQNLSLLKTNDILFYEGNRYQRFDIGMTWTDAKAYCEELGGHLVTITSQEEQDFINTLLPGTMNLYWFGLQETNGTCEWVTGEEYSYENWASNEPNDSSENYGQLYGKDYSGFCLGEWNDARDSGGYNSSYHRYTNTGFICEWENE